MTTFEFKLPELGDGIAEAEIMNWLAEEGASVSEHQPLVEVQTDKALVEITAPVTGILSKHGAPVGDLIKLEQVLAVFDIEAPQAADGDRATPPPSAGDEAGADRTPSPAEPAPTHDDVTERPSRRPLAAPTVRRLAREYAIDLADVAGQGPGGRILREDLEAFRTQRDSDDAVAPSERTPTAKDGDTTSAGSTGSVARTTDSTAQQGDSTVVPLRGLRRAIARKMTETLRTVPHVTGLIEIDVTELHSVLAELRPLAEQDGVRLTWTAFFAQATIQALKEFPQLNASLDMEREEVVQHHRVHLGVATATDQGLLVPVVRNADQLSLLELAAEIGRVSAAARDRTASPAELVGSTFTITNYGAVGGWHGTPMVNLPEIGIVGFGSVAPRPAVVDGELAVRTMVALSHTVDHRLIDGAINAQFGNAIRRRLEQPQLLLLGARHGNG